MLSAASAFSFETRFPFLRKTPWMPEHDQGFTGLQLRCHQLFDVHTFMESQLEIQVSLSTSHGDLAGVETVLFKRFYMV
jgi:hypothetical protein